MDPYGKWLFRVMMGFAVAAYIVPALSQRHKQQELTLAKGTKK